MNISGMRKRKFIQTKRLVRKGLGSLIDLRFRTLKKVLFYMNPFLVISDRIQRKGFESKIGISIPPYPLRRRVGAARDVEGFLGQGERCYSDIQSALQRVGKSIMEFDTILDFGCGCGRTLRWFKREDGSHSLWGVDIDGELVEWCKTNIPFANVKQSNPIPPLSFSPDSFDLIYSISVFSHLEERLHHKWLEELSRVLKSGGYAIISIHGEYCFIPYSLGFHMMSLPEGEQVPVYDHGRLKNEGYIFDPIDISIGYGNSFISENYVREHWSRYFEVVDLIPLGMTRLQDSVILRKQ